MSIGRRYRSSFFSRSSRTRSRTASADVIGGRARGGGISLSVRRRNGRLLMDVADDGAGLPGGTPAREGIGLSNTRERLRASFGSDHVFTVTGNGNGAVAHIDIPYRS